MRLITQQLHFHVLIKYELIHFSNFTRLNKCLLAAYSRKTAVNLIFQRFNQFYLQFIYNLND